jgi:DNA-binding GntR family transcriptional regulator
MLHMSSLQPVKAESLSAQVADSIREAIFSGELKPGQVLRELGLAKNMNVSQATVREALSSLEHYGLVIRTPNRSTSVTSLSQEEIRYRQSVQAALENLAFCEAAKMGSTSELEELDALSGEVRQAAESGDTFAMTKAGRRVHQRVWELSGNPVLHRMLDQLTTPLFAFWRLQDDSSQTAMDFANSHERLIRALRSRDSNLILAELQSHNQSIKVASPSEISREEQPMHDAVGAV